MPKAYVILTETIHDPEGMKAYAEKAAAASAPGMSMLAMDPDVQVLEGEWPEGRTIVLEFESVEAARAWYESDAYQAAVPLRQAAADCNVVIVSGLG
ncbi:MAG TPA: DUF1330 domain-containing protein [Acidimicrobiales bacterium]